jgi:RNA polymerase-binding transcription factor DksA
MEIPKQKRVDLSQKFLEKQLAEINERIDRYTNPKRIKAGIAVSATHVAYLEHKQKNTLPKLQEAKEKIMNGNYGFCKICGRPIEKERLILVPAAEHCLKCKK